MARSNAAGQPLRVEHIQAQRGTSPKANGGEGDTDVGDHTGREILQRRLHEGHDA